MFILHSVLKNVTFSKIGTSFFFVLEVLPQPTAKWRHGFYIRMLKNSGHDDADDEDEHEDELSEYLGQLCSDTELCTFFFLFSRELCASIDIHGSVCFIIRDDLRVGILLDQMAAGERGDHGANYMTSASPSLLPLCWQLTHFLVLRGVVGSGHFQNYFRAGDNV